MTALTTEQQKLVEIFLAPAEQQAKDWAKRYEPVDADEAVGVAHEALCLASAQFAPGRGTTVEKYIRLSIQNALRNWGKRRMWELKHGLLGGAPSVQKVQKHNPKGHRLVKSGQNSASLNSRDMDRSLTAPHEDEVIKRMGTLVSMLPPRLRDVADMRWRCQFTMAQISLALDLHVDAVRRRLDEAEGYARLYLDGGHA